MKNTFFILIIATVLVSCDKQAHTRTQVEKPIGYIPIYESDIRKFVNNPTLLELDKSIPTPEDQTQAPSVLDAAKKEILLAWDAAEKQVVAAWQSLKSK
jgi:hypothetical protein